MGTVGAGVEGPPLGPRVCDSEHSQLPTERNDGQGITGHILSCVWGLVLGTLALSFLFVCFGFWFLFLEGSPSVPIVLTQLYFKYDAFWQGKPSALLPWYFQNVSKCGKAPSWPSGWGKAGIGMLLGSLLLSSICFTIWKCVRGELLEWQVVFHFIPKIFISPDVVDCVRTLGSECKFIHRTLA